MNKPIPMCQGLTMTIFSNLQSKNLNALLKQVKILFQFVNTFVCNSSHALVIPSISGVPYSSRKDVSIFKWSGIWCCSWNNCITVFASQEDLQLLWNCWKQSAPEITLGSKINIKHQLFWISLGWSLLNNSRTRLTWCRNTKPIIPPMKSITKITKLAVVYCKMFHKSRGCWQR